MKIKHKIKKLIATIKSQRKKLTISFIVAIAINFVCYLMDNCPYPYWDNLERFCWTENLISRLSSSELNDDDAYFLDVAYDKQIADCLLDGDLHGSSAVTDRKKLLRFLQVAEQANSYKYIFLDIRFQDSITTPDDDALFNQINKMRDIGYSKHSIYSSTNKLDPKKASYNDYFGTITNTGFTRYQFIQNGEETAPVMIYNAVHPKEPSPINKHGIFYTSNGKLCQNSPFLVIKSAFKESYFGQGKENYARLGIDWLEPYSQSVVEALGDTTPLTKKNVELAIKDKIVFVGDFANDIHDTYIGAQPGPYLVYLAYRELRDGKHIVSPLFILAMIAVYMAIFIAILNQKSRWDSFKHLLRKSKSKYLLTTMSLTGYFVALIFFSYIVYILFGSLYFGILLTLAISFILYLIVRVCYNAKFANQLYTINNKIGNFALSFMGYTALLTCISLISYILFNSVYNVFFPSLFFTMTRTIITNIKSV